MRISPAIITKPPAPVTINACIAFLTADGSSRSHPIKRNELIDVIVPSETSSNSYVTRELSFEFHYFFMRKFWFVYLAKALVVFPGGFGTLDELFELLTLIQTGKIGKKLPIVLYGKEFWDDVLNLDALVRWGTISREDLDLLHVSDSPDDALAFLKDALERSYLESETK